jgi:hypothetical protein
MIIGTRHQRHFAPGMSCGGCSAGLLGASIANISGKDSGRFAQRRSGYANGRNLSRPQARGVDIGDGVLGDALLVGAGVVDRRSVTQTAIVALTVQRRRVMNLEEEFQELPISDARRRQFPPRGCR